MSASSSSSSDSANANAGDALKGMHTACVRGGSRVPGQKESHVLHSHTFPIFQTSTFVFDDTQHGADLFARKAEGHVWSTGPPRWRWAAGWPR
eukprot:m51a1_g13076 putative methionine gamma-lyase (93) ;mRNA; f:2204-2619